ncbi:hypothetical protein [Candidatus Coxiella mudrowiae]|uniref:hypothetical protein n=1 Tax=Candidatus Coxiella mudrowiae TaxID=2054173 RepID=UPI0012FEA1D4|nr:hypothetical protein [Candidatus Coxiella mudrowiae]
MGLLVPICQHLCGPNYRVDGGSIMITADIQSFDAGFYIPKNRRYKKTTNMKQWLARGSLRIRLRITLKDKDEEN